MTKNKENANIPVGRFAPSPTGRMHTGNIYAALMSWLSVRKRGGRWILRIEDLDPQRSKRSYAEMIEDDLNWLGLDWDEGGLENKGPNGPYVQSERGEVYEKYLRILEEKGLTYPCYCTRQELMISSAPHQSDGRVVYPGTCRPANVGSGSRSDVSVPQHEGRKPKTRLIVPDQIIEFRDRTAGPQAFNLAKECGDFILRRADGAWSYQLAVVVDDALMGVNEVVRGNDLLLSAAQQIYLYRLFGFPVPEFDHLPLLKNGSGQRLSKRDSSESMEELRKKYTPGQLLGRVAYLAGLMEAPCSVSLRELLESLNSEDVRT